ncbi:MAG: FG-GAP repeat protein [Spirochaetes bacterium]|nr:FG-GAP repeat protein [Spirochaetota bacterium]
MKMYKQIMFIIFTCVVFMTACGGGSDDSKNPAPNAADLRSDINGDGYPDLAIGAYYYGYYDADPIENEGRVYVFFGSSSGPASSPSQTIDSPLPDSIEGFGKYIVLDDFNGDGYSDMAVGNYYTSASYNGHVFIYYGSSSGLASTPGTTIKGADDTNLGWSLCSGNFNSDNYKDLTIGAPYGAGAVHVFYGSSAHIADCDLSAGGTADRSYAGGASETLGSSVIAGDFNGDGNDDLAALAGDGGYVDIYNGSSTGLPASYSARRSSLHSDTSSGCLASGNVHGDAYVDLAVGEVAHLSSTGRVCVYHGSSTGISAVNPADRELAGTYTQDRYGHSLSIADTDKDGYGDLAVGAHSFRNNEINQYYGAIYIYNGSSSGISGTETAHLYGANHSDYLGTIVNFIDVNADGNVDLYALAEGYEYSAKFFGRTYVYYGTASGISFTSPWHYDAECYIP